MRSNKRLSSRRLLTCLLLLGLLMGCGELLTEEDGNDDENSSPMIQAPQINAFSAEVVGNSEGHRLVTLSWEVSGTNPELSISPEPGAVTGTSVTIPLSATTYTLTAINSAGTSRRDITVNAVDHPAPPEDDPEPPSDPPEEEPLNLTGTWRLTAPIEIYNDCPLDWLFELSQQETQSGTVLTGSYGYGRDDPNASDPALTCSGAVDGIFNPDLEGSLDVGGLITLRGDYIYGTDSTGAPPEDEDRIILEATALASDTLTVNLEIIMMYSDEPLSTTATMQRVYTEPDTPTN